VIDQLRNPVFEENPSLEESQQSSSLPGSTANALRSLIVARDEI
jgi:hypothetical protein